MEAANENRNPNRVTNEGGQVRLIEGPKAIGDYRIKLLKISMDMYLKTGMIPTRGVTGARLVEMIAAVTKPKKPYPRSRKGKEQALADIIAYMESPAYLDGVEIINQ